MMLDGLLRLFGRIGRRAKSQLDLPNDFPLKFYNSVSSKIGPYQPIKPNEYGHFAGGWNGLQFRFKACAEHGDAFIRSIDRSVSPGHPERYHQERDLFGFFVSGYSAIECMAFACFALGAILDPAKFPMSTDAHLRAINLKSTSVKFAAEFPSEGITTGLHSLVGSTQLTDWAAIRNVLAHRAQPARTFVVGSSDPHHWNLSQLPLDRSLITNRRQWLSSQIALNVEHAADFAAKYFT